MFSRFPNFIPNNILQFSRRPGSDGSMSASGSAATGSIPDGVANFHLKIFKHRAKRGGDVHFLIARLYITNSKPFRSMYVEKAYSTVDSDSSVGWGR